MIVKTADLSEFDLASRLNGIVRPDASAMAMVIEGKSAALSSTSEIKSYAEFASKPAG